MRPATAVAGPSARALLCALAAVLAAPGTEATRPPPSRGASALQAGAVNATAAQGLRSGILGLAATLGAGGAGSVAGRSGQCQGLKCLWDTWGPCKGKPDENACVLRAFDSICACQKMVDECPMDDPMTTYVQGVLEIYCGECGPAEVQLYQNGCLSELGDHIRTDCDNAACPPLVCSYVAGCPTTEQAMKAFPTLKKEDMTQYQRFEDQAVQVLENCHHTCAGPALVRASVAVNVAAKIGALVGGS